MIDWVLFAERAPLPWGRLWVVLICPLLWLAVVLMRGAADGWVRYTFLDPAISTSSSTASPGASRSAG